MQYSTHIYYYYLKLKASILHIQIYPVTNLYSGILRNLLQITIYVGAGYTNLNKGTAIN